MILLSCKQNKHDEKENTLEKQVHKNTEMYIISVTLLKCFVVMFLSHVINRIAVSLMSFFFFHLITDGP